MSELEKKTMIRIRHLRKVYRIGDERVVALADINLDILQGQIVCVVGTSGSGKSTLLNQLAGLEKPSKGAVLIGKTNISRLSENQLAIFRQRHLGFVFQSYNLMPTLSALENVALPMVFKGIPRAKRDKAALAMLAAVGLKKRAGHRPTQMSGGQQQRVGIARAFVTRPKVVFADEPTGNLDTKTTVSVMQMMVQFARKYNQTLIIVTHDPELSDYADRVITLIDGAVTSDVEHTPIYDGVSEPPPLPMSIDDQAQADAAAAVETAAGFLALPTPPEEDFALSVLPNEDLLPPPDELPEDVELFDEADFISDTSGLPETSESTISKGDPL